MNPELLHNFWHLVVESAPWLLVGYLLAGIIKQVVPSSWVERQLARPGLGSIVRGAVIGAPLPLCSCGVIPTALAIRKAGASRSATASFLVATPETGVDSIAYSYAILGPVFAVARPLGALLSAVSAGVLVRAMEVDDNVVMGVIREQLGNRSLAGYLVGVITMAILCGLGLNQLFTVFDWSFTPEQALHEQGWSPWRQLTAMVLVLLMLRVLLRNLLGFLQKPAEEIQKAV